MAIPNKMNEIRPGATNDHMSRTGNSVHLQIGHNRLNVIERCLMHIWFQCAVCEVDVRNERAIAFA